MLRCHSHLLNVWIEDLPGAFLKPVHVHRTVIEAGNEVLKEEKEKEKKEVRGFRSD